MAIEVRSEMQGFQNNARVKELFLIFKIIQPSQTITENYKHGR